MGRTQTGLAWFLSLSSNRDALTEPASSLLQPTPTPNTAYIDALAAPSWALDFTCPRFTSNHRIRHGGERKKWENTIHTRTNTPDYLTIFSCGPKANHDREATRLLYSSSLPPRHRNSPHYVNVGITATAFDADLDSLVSAIRLAQDHLNCSLTQNVIILSTNPAAIQAITNLQPHAGQFMLESLAPH
jgi:hypothetical protein